MDMEKLFESISSEVLTEEIKLKLGTMFESALNEAIAAKEVELEESNRAEIAQFKEELTEQIDEYLNYFVEEFISENEGPIVDKVKVDTASKVLESFVGLVNQFNLELSDEKIDESIEIEELRQENNKLVDQVIESKKALTGMKKDSIVESKAAELATDVEKEKLRTLAETVECDDIFASKLDVFVEQIVAGRTKSPAEKLTEEEEIVPGDPEPITEAMKGYMRYLK
jgi:hypothetical protein